MTAWWFKLCLCLPGMVMAVQVEVSANGLAVVTNAEEFMIRNVESGNFLVGQRRGGYCDKSPTDTWYVKQCPRENDEDYDGFIWVYVDGKLQNKKTGRYLYSENWKTHEKKDNSEHIDWSKHPNQDCVDGKCYSWAFETDGRIREVNSGFFLCASSWGEHPDGDAEVRILSWDHHKNKKKPSDYPDREKAEYIGFEWEKVPINNGPGYVVTPECKPQSGMDFMIKNTESGNFLVGQRHGGYCDKSPIDTWYVKQCPRENDEDYDGFVWHFEDGKLQNKKTGRYLYAEKKWKHESKDNSEHVDWSKYPNQDCVDNKCYNWQFEDDGRIKHENSGFFLCASSWGEHPDGDSEIRVLNWDHHKNKKKHSDYPSRDDAEYIGYVWEAVCI